MCGLPVLLVRTCAQALYVLVAPSLKLKRRIPLDEVAGIEVSNLKDGVIVVRRDGRPDGDLIMIHPTGTLLVRPRAPPHPRAAWTPPSSRPVPRPIPRPVPRPVPRPMPRRPLHRSRLRRGCTARSRRPRARRPSCRSARRSALTAARASARSPLSKARRHHSSSSSQHHRPSSTAHAPSRPTWRLRTHRQAVAKGREVPSSFSCLCVYVCVFSVLSFFFRGTAPSQGIPRMVRSCPFARFILSAPPCPTSSFCSFSASGCHPPVDPFASAMRGAGPCDE